MLIRSIIFGLLLLPTLSRSATLEPLLLGAWENRTQGDLVGLQLNTAETCELYLERALQKRSTRACRYEAFEDRYQIYLLDANGQCDTAADFEFIFEPGSPLIRLQTGNGEVLLQKVVPHKTDTTP
jgi:hypothetical protein